MVNIFNLIHPDKVYTEEEYARIMDSGLEKDMKAYKDFIETYGKKIELIREFDALWDKDTYKKSEHRFKDIKELNKKIIRLINALVVDISRQKDVTKSFFYKILSKRANETGIKDMEQDQRSQYENQLKEYIIQINDDLKIIAELMKQQNNYVEGKRDWQTLKELRQHGDFFKLLNDEAVKEREIEHNILIVLKYLKKISEDAFYEDIEERLKRVRLVRAYPFSRDFKRFYYGPYIERFPDPDERESWAIINQRMKEGRYFVVIAKVDNEVVGGIVYCFLTYNDLTWGVIYWVCVLKNMRERGFKFVGSRLVETTKNDMLSMASYKKLNFKGIFGELNDPGKMTKEEIENDGMDPFKRLEFWKGMGMEKVFRGYVQLTSDPKLYVYYCSLYVIPMSKEWETEISSNDLYTFLLGNAVLGCGYTPEFLGKYKQWNDMMADFNRQKSFPLEKI